MSSIDDEVTYRRLLEARLAVIELKIDKLQAEIAAMHVKTGLLGVTAAIVATALAALLQRL